MTDKEALLATIAANPMDDTPRLVYADWLDEHGLYEEGAALRRAIHRHSPFESLIGRTIKQVRFDSNGDCLMIDTDSGSIRYEVEGDCCSESWFYRFLNPENLINEKLLFVMEGRTDDIDPDDGLGRQESESIYGYSLVTAKGICEITFRNSSNGYYGGWMAPTQIDTTPNESFQVLDSSWTYPPIMKCSRNTGNKCLCEKCLIPNR
jgi:uncharacterized protein (TIGR02996 family)